MRVTVLIDGSNMFNAQKELGWNIDFKRVLEYFTKLLEAETVKAYYFYPDHLKYREHDLFIAELVEIGYETICVRSKRYFNQVTRKSIKTLLK